MKPSQIEKDFCTVLSRDLGKAIQHRCDIYRDQMTEAQLLLGCSGAISGLACALMQIAKDSGTSPEALAALKKGIIRSIEELSP